MRAYRLLLDAVIARHEVPKQSDVAAQGRFAEGSGRGDFQGPRRMSRKVPAGHYQITCSTRIVSTFGCSLKMLSVHVLIR
jgi:hypothetical protein